MKADNKREYLRVDDVMHVEYQKVSQDKMPKKGVRKNISGGGILLHAPEEIPTGTLLKLMFEIPQQAQAVYALGKVVWDRPLGQKDEYKYEMGISFISIEEADRRKVIQYVFDQHRRHTLKRN